MRNPEGLSGAGKYLRIALLLSFLSVIFCLPRLSSANGAPILRDQDPAPLIPPTPPNVLWDQFNNVADSDISSQDFIDADSSFNIYDTRAADDFKIPEGDIWRIERVNVLGIYDDTPDPIQSLNIVFYTNRSARPDGIIWYCNYRNVLPDNILDPSFSTELPAPCMLTAGRYWVSVQADMLFVPNGQWFWFERTVQDLGAAVWENPGNGFGTGCVAFTPLQGCGADDGGLAFQLVGEVVDLTTPIPTLSEWGMICAAGALGIVSAVYLSRRRLRV
jgi:hypothetical protein